MMLFSKILYLILSCVGPLVAHRAPHQVADRGMLSIYGGTGEIKHSGRTKISTGGSDQERVAANSGGSTDTDK